MPSFLGKSYFDALRSYGFHKVLERYTSSGQQNKVICFLKTHLSGCSKEMHKDLFVEIYHFLTEGSTNGDNKISAPNEAELNHIIHYKSKCKPGTTFSKTALNWANENNDRVVALELLKLEKNIHHNKQCGLECLKDSLSSDALLPWIIETYHSFYEKTEGFLKVTAGITVFFELVLFSYMPFLYDFYSDVTLAKNYYGIAFSNDSIKEDSLWSCSSKLNSTCFEETSTMDINSLFAIAFWVTVATVIISGIIYGWVIYKHSDPKCITDFEKKMYDLGSSKKINSTLVKITAKSVRLFLSIVAKIFWPIVHIIRKYQYNASSKRSDHKDLTTESDDTWHTIKTVEYGIESSVQLCLQTWLLKPFFADITRWDSQQLVIKSVHGIMNFLTFNTYPACYIERALGKILLTVTSLALGVALMKSTKPGMGACERPLRTLPILFSILAQTVARIFAFRSLILIESGIHLLKYLIFLVIHFVLLFIIKILFETRIPKSRERKTSFVNMCSSPEKNKLTMLNIGKFIISGLASTIIMVSIHEENRSMRRKKYSFLPHFLFFSLILGKKYNYISLYFF